MKIYGKNIIIPAGIGWEKAAYKRGYEDGMEDQKEKLTTTSITENGTYTAEDGFSEVVVDVPEREFHLQPLNVTYMRNGRYEMTADPGYDGFQSPFAITVDVSGYTEEDLRNAYQSGWTDAMEECQRDWSKEYLTIEAIYAGIFNVNQPLDSSTNKGEWVSHESGYTLSLNEGDRVRFRGTALGQGAFSDNRLSFVVMGNAGSVIAGDDFEEVDNPGANGMIGMFSGCTGLADASNLILPSKVAANCYQDMFRTCVSLAFAPELPATVMQQGCYEGMFYSCKKLGVPQNFLPATTLADSCYKSMFEYSNIINAPELPATVMAEGCYERMFKNCSLLTTAPELPATTLAERCYEFMFAECGKIQEAPELPAEVMAEGCYEFMFTGCSSLEAAPVLSSTTLADNCYRGMFMNCTSLVSAPVLPATTLADYCYREMFENCSQLVVPPALPATTLTTSCYMGMFGGCLNMTSAPDLPASVLAWWCYQYMFDGCVRLAHIKCLATDISSHGCTEGWFNGHRPNGTFTKAAQMNDWTRGVDGIPQGWSVIDAS